MSRAVRPARRQASGVHPPAVVALLVLLVFGWVLWTGESPARAKQRVNQVPSQVGLWTGRSLEVDERTRQILETDEVALMEYRMGGEEPPVWFALEGGFGKRAAFHPPELCYVGSDFDILERQPITVTANDRPRRVMRLVISQGTTERVEAWYWFTVADRVTPNYYQQQLWLILDAILRKPSQGTLVRISTPLDDPEASHRRLLAFLTSFESAAPQRQAVADGL